MSEQNRELIRRWFEEVWNQRRESAIDEMMADDIVAHGLTPDSIRSREVFRQFHRLFIANFPRFHVTVEEVFSHGDRLGYRCRVQGTHSSGKEVDFEGGGFVRVRDGMLAEGHNIFNFHEMLAQLGTIAPDALLTAVAGDRGS
jgi:ketosteroid isomerase-like protein